MLQTLRSILFHIAFYASTTSFVVLGSPLLLGPRSWAMAALEIHAEMEILLLRYIAGIRLEVRGEENLVDGACIVASKHQSAFETFALVPQLEDPVYLMKKELFRIPFHGWFSYKFGMIPVARDQGAKALREMLKEAEQRIADGRQLIIFPEGTRRPAGAPPDYKTGIFLLYQALKVPCVPVALNSGLYWPRHHLKLNPGTIVIEFLPALPPGLPKREFLPALQDAIETASDRLLEEAKRQSGNAG
ncbi:lysophospholipid acyltransferase family protein [Methyloligella sp. 2.7D]|uniref:lysophospholipid acyltransferase family protein n=1 Tax=unclassified Methyloligella TaxID=2625955 RepID=UPI00157DD5D5|nr:lysophospholipid acyltransferase family protein [Methyloligella sp. GL2]QKP76468.1 1-acyl-sn-glycerol-3-phosphate acyltransferase [Methyloligella sp. GL2]